MIPKQKKTLLFVLIVLLIALSTHYYGAVYLPSLARAEAMRIELEAQR